MPNNRKINLQEIADKVDTLIELIDDRKMIDSYPTQDLLKMVEEDFDWITSVLAFLPDIDIHGGRLP